MVMGSSSLLQYTDRSTVKGRTLAPLQKSRLRSRLVLYFYASSSRLRTITQDYKHYVSSRQRAIVGIKIRSVIIILRYFSHLTHSPSFFLYTYHLNRTRCCHYGLRLYRITVVAVAFGVAIAIAIAIAFAILFVVWRIGASRVDVSLPTKGHLNHS